ncbi:ABC-type phosphonate transport system ATPase subunit [Bradyrhizobium sp. i1.8.4]|uniref:hypothetical protein n=1 Tax=unclassified Bradyrhizobium TaxID=2631580 RepID=UPI003D1DE813
MAEPILQLRDVSLSFKGIKALNALSFDVERGETISLNRSSMRPLWSSVQESPVAEISRRRIS